MVRLRNYDLYLAKLEESRISSAMDTEKISNVKLIEPAYPPLKPISPKKKLNILIGIFLGLFGGLVTSFLIEKIGDKLETPEDIDRALGLPVLTSVPIFRK